VQRKRRNRGFTLVELGTVVVIVGVLATLAIVGYRKMMTSSQTAEATHMIQAIRAAQEAYRAEVGVYANIASSLDNFCPTRTTWPSKASWDPTCTAGTTMTWAALPVHVDGPVRFGYSTVAGRVGDPMPNAPSGMGQTPTFAEITNADWFVIAARGDMDGNGTFCTAVGASWTNDVFIDREGE
jgi:type IV pilus assembly protein PilA